jgi:AcrR family transcriptional regulator
MARVMPLKKGAQDLQQAISSTKERLLQVAQDLFAQKGFHAASTREITQRANTNVASLYFHWRSKENLYLAVYRRLFQQLTQVRQGMIDLLEEGLRAHKSLEAVLYPIADWAFDFFAANPELARLNLHRILEGGALAVKVEYLEQGSIAVGVTFREYPFCYAADWFICSCCPSSHQQSLPQFFVRMLLRPHSQTAEHW